MKKLRLIVFLTLGCLVATSAWGQKKPAAQKLKPRPNPVLQLENGMIISKTDGVLRPGTQTVCAGDKLAFNAKIAGTEEAAKLPIKWTVTSGQGVTDETGRYVLDTTGLKPGSYIVTAETTAAFKDCDGGCTAYDSKSFVVADCEIAPSCFTSPRLNLTSATQTINPGETINICSDTVTGGYNFGTLVPTWSSSAGKISGDVSCAKLDTTGIAPGSSINVNLNLKASDLPGCEAKGTITFKVAEPVLPVPVELTPCNTFKTNSARVDNACKAILMDAVRRLESDPGAQLVIDAFHRKNESSNLAFERGKNVRDRMADGSIGVSIDANRLLVRPSGTSADGGLVKIYLIPAGAKIPTGANTVNVGNVKKEGRRATGARHR